MSMSKFNAGDKVKILDGSKIKNYIGGWAIPMELYVGQTATVRSVHYDWVRGWYYRLELTGLCRDCKWDERGLEKACRTKDGADQKIVIYRSGQSVIAKDYSTGKTAEAKCSPADEFDFHTGAKLAFTRLVDPDREAKPNVPEKPKYYTGKVVCVKAHFPHMWTPGKVYTIIDGETKDNCGDIREKITSPAQMSAVTDPRNEFIEYKGGA
jgi:hypothetical protein